VSANAEIARLSGELEKTKRQVGAVMLKLGEDPEYRSFREAADRQLVEISKIFKGEPK